MQYSIVEALTSRLSLKIDIVCRQITNNDYNKDVYCFSNNHCHSCHSVIHRQNNCQPHITPFGAVESLQIDIDIDIDIETDTLSADICNFAIHT